MQLVLGQGPIAEGLAAALGLQGEAVLAGPTASPGAFVWRKVDLARGEGVLLAAKRASRVHVVLNGPEPVAGALAVLARLDAAAGTLVLPPDVPPPTWAGSRLIVGPAWGGAEPLVAAWSKAVAAGRHVWLADAGLLKPVAVGDAVDAILALQDHANAQWTLVGDSVGLPVLLERVARFHGRPARSTRVPLALAMWWVGLRSARLRSWRSANALVRETPGWDASLRGPVGFTDGLKRR